MSHRQEKVKIRLQEIVAEALNEQAGTQSLITVTHCDISPDLKKVTVFISVFPEQHEEDALNFSRRQRPKLRAIIAKELPIKVIPFVEIEIDTGEKNRQKIERLINEF